MASGGGPVLSFELRQDVLYVRLPAEVADWETAREAVQQLQSLVRTHSPNALAVDLQEVLHMQSELLGVLVAIARDAVAAGGYVELQNCPKALREVLRVTRVQSLFRMPDAAPQPSRPDAPPSAADAAPDENTMV
ncbi:MAG: anti-sigma factor antagonist [Planctomycetota bacterium]|nr:MAG: anti-sigma factor antagonist [Planctomycetota bacterium]